ncbi:MAG: hydroxysqualene dehydroxylase HpnE [Tepidisphaeraceae bacterium]
MPTAPPPANLRSSPRIIVIGGGLAGIAAAVALESRGLSVSLLEARQQAGGRAGSFKDPRTGELLDNCQHVLLGCCTNLIGLYRRIGALDQIHFQSSIFFAAGKDRWRLFGVPGLPAPLHLGPALAAFSLLSMTERLELAAAMTRILCLSDEEMRELMNVPFSEWLDEQGQSAELIRKLYDPIVISGLNEETRAAGAGWAIKIFRDSLLVNSRGYLFGLPQCPLGKLYERLALRDLHLSTRLSEHCFDGRRVSAVKTQDGQTFVADAVVLATNHHTLNQWIPADLWDSDARFAGLSQLQSVPILGAHLWFDQPILNESHLALVDGPLQWLFRKDASGSALHGVISAARDWVGIPHEQCLAKFEEQVRTLFPRAANAKLIRGSIVIEKRATFSPLPGVNRLRPEQAPPEGGIENLFLAGDYSLTGWPATMEGAVRSGYLAADAVMRALPDAANHASFVVPDLPLEWPARSIRHFSSGRKTSSAAR